MLRDAIESNFGGNWDLIFAKDLLFSPKNTLLEKRLDFVRGKRIVGLFCSDFFDFIFLNFIHLYFVRHHLKFLCIDWLCDVYAMTLALCHTEIRRCMYAFTPCEIRSTAESDKTNRPDTARKTQSFTKEDLCCKSYLAIKTKPHTHELKSKKSTAINHLSPSLLDKDLPKISPQRPVCRLRI